MAYPCCFASGAEPLNFDSVRFSQEIKKAISAEIKTMQFSFIVYVFCLGYKMKAANPFFTKTLNCAFFDAEKTTDFKTRSAKETENKSIILVRPCTSIQSW